MSEYNQAFRNMRTFSITWFGLLILTIGSGLTGIALGFWIYEQTRSPNLFSIRLLVYFIPRVLLSLFAGVMTIPATRHNLAYINDALRVKKS